MRQSTTKPAIAATGTVTAAPHAAATPANYIWATRFHRHYSGLPAILLNRYHRETTCSLGVRGTRPFCFPHPIMCTITVVSSVSDNQVRDYRTGKMQTTTNKSVKRCKQQPKTRKSTRDGQMDLPVLRLQVMVDNKTHMTCRLFFLCWPLANVQNEFAESRLPTLKHSRQD